MKVKNIITTQELFFEIKVIPKITGTNITPPLGNILFSPSASDTQFLIHFRVILKIL